MTKEKRKRLAAIRAIAPLAMPPVHSVRIPPEARMMKDDDELGMAWWNALTDEGRAHWSKEAGDTGRAVDAWKAFKRSKISLPAVSRASHYS